MTNYTLEQLRGTTDKRLDQISCANEDYLDTWEPTADTLEGKAQAWNLAQKYELDIDFEEGAILFPCSSDAYTNTRIWFEECGTAQRTAVIAVILLRQENND